MVSMVFHPSIPPCHQSILLYYNCFRLIFGFIWNLGGVFRSVFYVIRVRPHKMLIGSLPRQHQTSRCFPGRLQILISTSTLSWILSTHLVSVDNYFHLLRCFRLTGLCPACRFYSLNILARLFVFMLVFRYFCFKTIKSVVCHNKCL